MKKDKLILRNKITKKINKIGLTDSKQKKELHTVMYKLLNKYDKDLHNKYKSIFETGYSMYLLRRKNGIALYALPKNINLKEERREWFALDKEERKLFLNHLSDKGMVSVRYEEIIL